jgi:rhomboid protease GluP
MGDYGYLLAKQGFWSKGVMLNFTYLMSLQPMNLITENQDSEEETDEQMVCLGTYPTLDNAFDHALVALALGEAVRVEHGEKLGEFDLQAEPEAAPKITRELEEYTANMEEQGLPKVTPSNWARHPAGIPLLLLWFAVLLLVFYFQIKDPSITDRYSSSSIALLKGAEWWRPFTALFLHGDGLHLAGNMALGSIFVIMVSKSIGSLKGMALTLLSGTLGNATTSFVTYPDPFVSLGASTAVFGALGILSGIGLVENFRHEARIPWLRVMAPILAGLVLLGWFGGAEPGSNTDVFGHVFGFSAGVLSGSLCRYMMSDASQTLHPSGNQVM